ncbi:hypothetical protein ACIQ2D_21565 [Lysinibacillus sp. NPDC097287]|uniref:hypothetical protein n=1 Tax=Lysinibacillus sp. NPDC097287 TaxID=3364144 RepID=UPI00381765D0
MGLIKQLEEELEQARTDREALERECVKLLETASALNKAGKKEEARKEEDLFASKQVLFIAEEAKIYDLKSKLGEVGISGLYHEKALKIIDRKNLRKAWDTNHAALKKAKEDYEQLVARTNDSIEAIEYDLKQTDDRLRDLLGVNGWVKMF